MKSTETMTQHTPGPWRASRFDEWECTAVILDAHEMPKGRTARTVQQIGTAHGATPAETWANACLIAAAPVLRGASTTHTGGQGAIRICSSTGAAGKV
jgi:hypothetical protein